MPRSIGVSAGVLGLILFSLVSIGAFAAEERLSTSELRTESKVGSPLAFGLDIQYLPARYPNYDWGSGSSTGKVGKGLRVAFEWIPLVSRYGKAGIGLGLGYTKISDAVFGNSGPMWLETIPIDLSVNYRFDFYHDQPLVPFLKVGRERQLVLQKASDGQVQYNGITYGGGVAFLLDAIDKGSAQALDNSTGINHTFLIVEYMKSAMTGVNKVNLTRDELRLGLRFEM